eukprot:TRINITY_DN45283_c0_g1_i1.p2 TRINITY_DN45283_c0_g1~~TRINITY_DN45283_c0_g1_i1.p2  ORF type:complete len:662 (+),score=182.11 TRINITY_DN45283_c0_g1_i1:121-2106(+)
MKQVIVVGGGLAGLSAAHTVIENGGRVVLIDKMAFLGGNSTKATSGINGTPTAAQKANGVPDSVEIFTKDVTDSAGHLARPDLIKLLTHESGPAVEWCSSAFGVDLSKVSRLGGHSQPRTHRGKEKFPGFAITYAMIEKLEAIAKAGGPARIVTKARVVRFLTDDASGSSDLAPKDFYASGSSGASAPVVTGVEFEQGGVRSKVYGAVVIATGGYAADFSPATDAVGESLLLRHRPDLQHLPTTNGEHCTGDGVKLAAHVGADLVDMDMVQVHPTGLVFPNEPDAKVLFLAAEALRGVGAILLNARGERFCDELGRRDYVSGRMFEEAKNGRAPFRLVLNSKASSEIEWHCKHYCGRGVMKKFASGAELAKELNVPEARLAETLRAFNTVRPDPHGRKFFDNLPYEMADHFHVAIVTPVVHYTMGGVGVDGNAQVTSSSGKQPVGNLFAAGEVVGGVHGKNRLGGNSLLDCVVYGRAAGRNIMRSYVAHPTITAHTGGTGGEGTAARRLASVVAHLSPSQSITISIDLAGSGTADGASSLPVVPSAPAVAAQSSAPAQAPAVGAGSAGPADGPSATSGGAAQQRTFTKAEVAKHNTKGDCWVIVNGQVLDVTDFLADHPGGSKAILVFAGKDASEEFNMLHNANVIEKYMTPKQILGTVSD